MVLSPRKRALHLTANSTRMALLGLGAALICIIWAAVWLQIDSQRRAMLSIVMQEASDLALVLEQNTERSATEMDRMIKYLRTIHTRMGDTVSWPSIVQSEFNTSNRTAQISVIDTNGIMITSSKMLYPKHPVDLSDREHFKVHALAKIDRLFISKPVFGRVSKKWSVQFTRPFFNRAGEFAGVIVVSLDADFMSRSFGELSLGSSGGLALVGKDGIVRSGAGIYRDLLGKSMPTKLDGLDRSDKVLEDVTINWSASHGPVTTVERASPRFPLKAVITRSDAPQYKQWLSNAISYVIGGLILNVVVVIVIAVSIMRHTKFERELRLLARTDSLSGLMNRRALQEHLAELFSEAAEKRPFSLFLIDLDGFKYVNDRFGHPVGDELLVAVSRRLLDLVPDNSIVARMGGDEFAIVTMNTDSQQTSESLADQICAALRKPFATSGLKHEIGGSLGLIAEASAFHDPAELMRCADLALYAAKTAGRDCWRVFNERMNDEVNERTEIEAGLRAVLQQEQLEVFYQPIVSASTEKTSGYEALVRWRHPEKGLVPPSIFIPVAEQTGFIVNIGAWVLRRACADFVALPGKPKVSVNVSAVEFRDSNVAETIRNELQRSGLEPSRLRIEITESLLMARGTDTLDQLREIRGMGVEIALDDFGTGYSSLSYLQSYPIDCIKIDQSFVRGLSNNKVTPAIIQAITSMAVGMGISTVAEGIETEAEAALIIKLGCTELQGYYFGRPQPLSEMPALQARKAIATAA
ncbi:MAG: EAL domain-containing protein [Hyphomicrobiaceae bacterium]